MILYDKLSIIIKLSIFFYFTTGNRIASELNPNYYSVIFMSYLLEISSLFNRTKFLNITVKRTVKLPSTQNENVIKNIQQSGKLTNESLHKLFNYQNVRLIFQ